MLLESPRPIPPNLAKRLQQLRESMAGERRFHAVVLFGSLARGDAHSWSDVDIGILVQEPLDFLERTKLTTHVESILGRPVDVVDLQRAPLALQGRAVRDAVPIIITNSDVWGRFVALSTMRWLDYRPMYERAVQMAVRRLAEVTT